MKRHYITQLILLLVCGLIECAGAQGAGAQRPLTNFAQALALPQKEAQKALPVALTAWVMMAELQAGTALLRDATGSWEMKTPALAANLIPGQRIRIEGKTRWNSARADLDVSSVSIQQQSPVAKSIGPGDRAPSADAMEWAEVEGVVAFAGVANRELLLDVSQRGHHLTVQVARCDLENVSGLLHGRIRLRGLAQGISSVDDEVSFCRMWVARLEEIQLVDPTIQDWNSCPISTAVQLEAVVAGGAGTNTEAGRLPAIGSRARVCGQIEEGSGGEYELRDASGSVIVARSWAEQLNAGAMVEALGILGERGGRPILYCASFRADISATGKLPLLTTIEQIHRLKPEEADRHYPVRVRGVATGGLAYIQDGTRGISVSNAFNRMSFGGFYEVEGTSGGGLYAPVIEFTKITYLGPGQLPEPMNPTWGLMASGSAANQWLEIKGVVVSTQTNTLTIAMRGGRVQAEVRTTETNSLAGMVNAVVRVRGTCRSEYNERRHLTRFWIDVPSPWFISVEDPPRTDPFDVGSRSVAEIRQFDVDAYQIRRIKVGGQITCHVGQDGYLSDGTNGLKYSLGSVATLVPGDIVDLVGFPDAGGFSPTMREALWRRVGHAKLPEAPLCSLEELLGGDHDSTRVRARGKVLATSSDLRESVLTLLMESRVVAGRVQLTAGGPRAVAEVGSTVELTGICVSQGTQEGSGAATNSVELLVQSPADVVILERPSWWTLKHSLQVIGVLVTGLLLALGWASLLRFQVSERTRQLKAQMMETERTERQRALEQERSRIARDLHDNLGSSLTEISMLAETGHRSVADDPRDRFGQILNRAHVLVHTLDETVWAIDPGKDTLPALVRYLTAFAEEFVSAAGISCRVDVPAAVPDHELTADLRHDLFLATKEALNNAARHSHARQVTFQISLVSNSLEIRITDDGHGFDFATSTPGDGLRNLRERMGVPGRRCEIGSRPGSGTTVLLAVTLPNKDSFAPA
jgi:signal transduction histidine kinase